MNYDHYQMPEKMADPAGVTRVSEAQVHPLLAQYFEQLAPSKSMKETVVKDLGQIKQMNIPSGWNSAYKEPSRGMGARSYSSFSLADDKDVAISFFYRGSALRQTGQAQAFHSTIEGATHTLTSVEFHSIFILTLMALERISRKFFFSPPKTNIRPTYKRLTMP